MPPPKLPFYADAFAHHEQTVLGGMFIVSVFFPSRVVTQTDPR